MQIFVIVAAGAAVFLYLLSQSVADNADMESLNTVGDFNTSGEDVILMTTPDRQALLAAYGHGIAQAEGYYQPNTIPASHFNPGDIKVGGQIATFLPDSPDMPVPGGGWAALYHQLNLILNASSSIYKQTWTLYQMCAVWTDLLVQDPNGFYCTVRGCYSPDGSVNLDNYTALVVQSLNQSNFGATQDTTIGDLAAGNFSS